MKLWIKIKQAQVAFDMERNNNEANLKAMLMKQEFAYNQQLNNITETALSYREGAREEAKNNRIKIMPSVIGTTKLNRFEARSKYSNCPDQVSE